MTALTLNSTSNPFADYARAMAPRRFDGRLLRFSKGDFLVGPGGDGLPAGTKLAALMPTLTIGWEKWESARLTDCRLGLLAEGFNPPRRAELGDDDSETWETDANGDRLDPWRYVNNLVFVSPDADEIFTFAASSRGALGAIGELRRVFAKAPAGAYPLVSLEVGSYQHKNKTLGRIKFPIFKVVEFVNALHFDAALAVSRGEPVQLSPTRAEFLPGAPVEPAPPTAAADSDIENYAGCDPADAIPF
jgi:hypothetical protein